MPLPRLPLVAATLSTPLVLHPPLVASRSQTSRASIRHFSKVRVWLERRTRCRRCWPSCCSSPSTSPVAAAAAIYCCHTLLVVQGCVSVVLLAFGGLKVQTLSH